MTEYSFYNCIRCRKAKTRQNIRSNCKLSVRMPFVLPKQK